MDSFDSRTLLRNEIHDAMLRVSQALKGWEHAVIQKLLAAEIEPHRIRFETRSNSVTVCVDGVAKERFTWEFMSRNSKLRDI